MKSITFYTAAAIGALVIPTEAHAYLDPGAGSMLIQLLLGGVAGAAVILKLYWSRIRTLLGFKPKDEKESE